MTSRVPHRRDRPTRSWWSHRAVGAPSLAASRTDPQATGGTGQSSCESHRDVTIAQLMLELCEREKPEARHVTAFGHSSRQKLACDNNSRRRRNERSVAAPGDEVEGAALRAAIGIAPASLYRHASAVRD